MKVLGNTSTNGYRIQQRDTYGEIVARDVEAQIKLTTLNDIQKALVINLLLLGKDQVTNIYYYNDIMENSVLDRLYVPFHEISGPFYQKCNSVFQRVFYGSYRKVLGRAFSSLDYLEH
ncbi:uncharacterized protein NPIL_617491 [Nephila pilipes]|uniref:Uncharacterized protein n=1 Tax=Nephila pilipes TaxID=299642 RepID=A0A8X6NTH8_NEPPI|nr:uncharacterized protein NPIL_617491 [Nephila pilipes]